jgi:hypothetical protein
LDILGSRENKQLFVGLPKVKSEIKKMFQSFAVELVVYGTLVVGYFFLVLHFLGDWLNRLFLEERKTYAFVSVFLIIAQGFVLELLTRLLLRLIRRKVD